jgi:cysteine desulfurase
MDLDHAHLSSLRDMFVSELEKIPRLHLNGHPTQNYPGIINYSFEFIEGEALMMAVKNVAVSSGSACTSASLEPSYVLRSLGVSEDLAHTSIRFSMG